MDEHVTKSVGVYSESGHRERCVYVCVCCAHCIGVCVCVCGVCKCTSYLGVCVCGVCKCTLYSVCVCGVWVCVSNLQSTQPNVLPFLFSPTVHSQ